jgi:hypothetical protein
MSTMEWFLSCLYWPAVNPATGFPDPARTASVSSPTDLDLWLIRLLYAVPAGQPHCIKCGARVDRRLRLATQYSGRSPYWRVSVARRCGGWRRHRHVAVVTESSSGLQFAPLRNPHDRAVRV